MGCTPIGSAYRRTPLPLAASGVLFLILTNEPAIAQGVDEAYLYGEFLANQCASCHLDSGDTRSRRSGIPDIWSMTYPEFEQRFVDVKTNSDNVSMRALVESLTEEDRTALLHYFSRRLKANDGA